MCFFYIDKLCKASGEDKTIHIVNVSYCIGLVYKTARLV